MYDIAGGIADLIRTGQNVELAWVVDVRGFSSRSNGEALALTPDGGRIGSVLSGAIDDRLARLLKTESGGQLVEIPVSDQDAVQAGFSCGGVARCVLSSASNLPTELWPHLQRREPTCLVTELDGDHVGATRMFTTETITEAGPDVVRLFRRGTTEVALLDGALVTALWPIPRLVIVGGGAIPDALTQAALLLGWSPQSVADDVAATSAIGELCAVDGVVVTSHERELDGPALRAALAGTVGYIGALGSRRTQQARTAWLTENGITDLSRIHGPAGLRIGANTPAEIAVSIVAEMLSAKAGVAPESLSESAAPIHADPHAAWPRVR